jgi:prepilin-type N-terminal cleavage/methylation domain-containing protein
MPKSQQRITFTGFLSSLNGQRGLTLIETLIALAILAAVAVVFLVGMTTSTRGVIVTQEQVSGEGLAKSQMESIKQQDYRVDQLYTKLDQAQIPTGYDIGIMVQPMNPRGDTTHNDDGLQRITITITHGGKTVFTLEGYKRFIS